MLEADKDRVLKEREAQVISEREQIWKEELTVERAKVDALRSQVMQPHFLVDSQQVAYVGE